MSWVLAFVGFSVLVILHEFGHFMAAKAVGMRVERFSLFFPPLLAKKKVGETEYAIGALPLGGYVKISGMNPEEDLPDEVKPRAYYAQPVWKRVVVIAAGPVMNLIIAFVLLVVYFGLIGAPTQSDRVRSLEKTFPAYGQLKPGDRIVSVDGKSKVQDFAGAIAAHRCAGAQVRGCAATTAATVVIDRDGKRSAFRIKPQYDPSPQGRGGPRTRLGFAYAEGPREPFSFGHSVDVSAERFWYFTKQTLSLPARILDAKKRKEISGIVGSYEFTRQTILNDIADAVALLAFISLSLAIINLFPFLPLDGGHIFWALVEKVRGRAVSYATMERASVVGFMLVIMLFAIGLSNDIGRLTGEGFNVR